MLDVVLQLADYRLPWLTVPSCHSKEFELFSIFPTPSIPINTRLSRENITNFRLYHNHEIPDFITTSNFSCKISGFPDLFYTNLIWNPSQLSSLGLEFQIFFRDRKNTIGSRFYLEQPIMSITAQLNKIK